MAGSWTPGPWEWFGSGRHHNVYLATTHSGRLFVMGFRRWGMGGAQPEFQIANKGMIKARDLLQFEVGEPAVVGIDAAKADPSVYRYDIRGIDHPDARLIAEAPTMADYIQRKADEGDEEALAIMERINGQG